MRKHALTTAFCGALAVTAWSVSAFFAGIYWILRDSKYQNDVMISALIIAAVLSAFSIRLALRIRRRMGRFAEPT